MGILPRVAVLEKSWGIFKKMDFGKYGMVENIDFFEVK